MNMGGGTCDEMADDELQGLSDCIDLQIEVRSPVAALLYCFDAVNDQIFVSAAKSALVRRRW